MQLGVALYNDLLACLENDWLIARSGADLRTLGVNEDRNLVRNLAGVLDNSANTLMIHMGSVATDDIHAGLMEFTDELDVAADVRNRGDDFCKFLLHR